MKNQKIKIVQDEQKPVERGVLAAHIIEISRHMSALLSSGLNRRAIVALVHDRSKVSKSTIEVILNNLEDLDKDYCR